MANSLSFNGNYLATYGAYLLKDFVVPSMPTPKLNTSEVVGRHGGYLLNSKYQIRDIPVPMLLKGYADAAAFYTAIDNLNTILDIQLGQKPLIFDYNPNRYLTAIASSNFDAKKLSLVAADAKITFKCVDPFWFSTTLITFPTVLTISPQLLSVTPGGNVDIEPVITITTNATISIGTEIKIYNITANRSLMWITPVELAATDVIIIDCATWLVKYNGIVSMATLDHGSVFPVLVPSVTNLIRVTGVPNGLISIVYRNRYL